MPEVTLSLPVALAILAGFLVIGAGALYFTLQGTHQIQAPTAIPSPTITATLTATPTDTLIPTDTPTLTPQPPVEYTVQAGDSCGAIASLYNSSVTAIISLNSLNSTCTNLAIGQKIKVPLPTPTQLPPPTATLEAAAATRAIAARAERLDPEVATTAYLLEDRAGKVFVDSTRSGGATVVAAYSPRVRPGVPVSFPLTWDQLDDVTPTDFTIRTAAALLGNSDPWQEQMPEPQSLPGELVEEGQAIPIARVQAMHEGKRRARARRE